MVLALVLWHGTVPEKAGTAERWEIFSKAACAVRDFE